MNRDRPFYHVCVYSVSMCKCARCLPNWFVCMAPLNALRCRKSCLWDKKKSHHVPLRMVRSVRFNPFYAKQQRKGSLLLSCCLALLFSLKQPPRNLHSVKVVYTALCPYLHIGAVLSRRGKIDSFAMEQLCAAATHLEHVVGQMQLDYFQFPCAAEKKVPQPF